MGVCHGNPGSLSPFVYNVGSNLKNVDNLETRVMAFGVPVRVSWTIKLLTLPLFCPLHSFILGRGTPSNGLIVMCHWMVSHCHGCVDHYGVAFLYKNGAAHFQAFGGQKIQVFRDLTIERFTSH